MKKCTDCTAPVLVRVGRRMPDRCPPCRADRRRAMETTRRRRARGRATEDGSLAPRWVLVGTRLDDDGREWRVMRDTRRPRARRDAAQLREDRGVTNTHDGLVDPWEIADILLDAGFQRVGDILYGDDPPPRPPRRRARRARRARR